MCWGDWPGWAGRTSPAALPARVSLDPGKGGGAAGGEDGMDQACRPGMESVQQRLTRATWLHFGSGHQRQGVDGIWDVWLVLGWKSQQRPCGTVTASLTVVSNPCNVWSVGGEAAENEVTYRNMPKTWMLGNETPCVLLSWLLIYERWKIGRASCRERV